MAHVPIGLPARLVKKTPLLKALFRGAQQSSPPGGHAPVFGRVDHSQSGQLPPNEDEAVNTSDLLEQLLQAGASRQGGAGMAAEMYLAGVMQVDDQQAAERTYLDELAYHLRLDPDLQAQLERQACGNA